MNARTLLPFLPAACVLVLAVAGWWNLRQRDMDARRELAAMSSPREQVSISALPNHIPGSPGDLQSLRRKLETLEAALPERETDLAKTRAEISDVLAQTPVAPDELTSSFGKIDDMGRETGNFLQLFVAVSNPKSVDGMRMDEMAEEKMKQIENSFFKFLAWMPLLGELESTPAEIARFHAAALREYYQLGETAAAQMESVIASHFTQIAANGLTVSDRPPEDGEEADAWKAGRSDALAALMVELRPLLPESNPVAEKHLLPSLLNIGVGLETKSYKTPDGKSATSMGTPSWPTPPWLEK